MLIAISLALHIYFVYWENMHILQLTHFVLIAHELRHFEKDIVLNMLTKWDLQNDIHVKYRQDNLHRMTSYTGMCSSNGHGRTIHVSFMVKSVLYGALDPLVS